MHTQAEEPDRTKQRMMFGNPYRQEKNDGGADEGWSEGTGGLLQRGGRKRRRRIQQQGDATPSPSLSSSPSTSNLSSLADSSAETSSSNAEVTSPQRGQQPSIDSVNTGTAIVELGTGTQERKDNDHIGTDKGSLLRAHQKSVSISEKLSEYGGKVEKADNVNEFLLAQELGSWAMDQRRKRHMAPPVGVHQDQSHVVAFLLSVIRALRHAKSSHTKQVILCHLISFTRVLGVPILRSLYHSFRKMLL